MPSYDPANIFAKILRGELPCHKVYEDEHALAFLDIMPRAPGHTLVLPKSPARNLLDVDPADLAHVMQVAQKIAKAGMTVFGFHGGSHCGPDTAEMLLAAGAAVTFDDMRQLPDLIARIGAV